MADNLGSKDIKRRVSHAKKVANDFKRQREIMDAYDEFYGFYRDDDEIEKFNINYDLFNGRMDIALYDDPICVNIDGEKINIEHHSIVHYPLISQIANAMYGEMINRPFKPMAVHVGTYAETLKGKKWNALLGELINLEVIQPMVQMAMTKVYDQQKIEENPNLTPDQLVNLQEQVSAEVKGMTPQRIVEFMENDFQTPTQRQAQQFLDYFVDHLDIKYTQQEGFKHALITGKEIYFVGDRYDEPTFELVNPKYFTWGGSQNTEWIQDAAWAKYEQWLTYEDATSKYSEYLKPGDYDYIEEFFEPIGRFKPSDIRSRKDAVQEAAMYELSLEDGPIVRQYGGTNIKTKEGQKEILKMYDAVIRKYGAQYGYDLSLYGIREAHFTWRDKRKFYRVSRYTEDGLIEKVWRDEHYKIKPDDIEVEEIWVDEIWEGTKLGTTDPIYVNIRPVPGQWKSAFNPHGNKLPYIGKAYNRHMNNSKNVAYIDLGKPFQREFDITMAQVKFHMATDVGNVFLMSLQLKPDHWKWQQWLDVIKTNKLAIFDGKKHGLNQIDATILKTLNLSSSQDIASKLAHLQWCREELTRAMNYSQARLGSAGQYATNENIQASTAASFNQTEIWFETHRQIVEKALNIFMNRVRFLYRNDKFKKDFILDDVARMELEITSDFWYEEVAIEFSTSTEDINKLELLRREMQAFVQNGMSFDGILELSLAETPSDIQRIMKRETRRIEEQRQQEIQIRREEFEQQLAAQQQIKMAEMEMEYRKHMETLMSQEKRTLLDQDKFRLQADADKDGQADVLEKAAMELAVKKYVEDQKARLKDKELDIRKDEVKARLKQRLNKKD